MCRFYTLSSIVLKSMYVRMTNTEATMCCVAFLKTYMLNCNVALLIFKVDSGSPQTPAVASVIYGQKVQCCVEGKPAKCITPRCKSLDVPGESNTYLLPLTIGVVLSVVSITVIGITLLIHHMRR